MKITNIGSASFIVEISGIRILTDPWFWGKGFINGWSPLVFPPEHYDFGHIDYIWFSHEHPDHFHPGTLKLLMPKLKEKPTILFQETLNKRVLNFLQKKLGLDVIEVKTYKPFKLNKEITILIGDVGIYDSYLQVRDSNHCFSHLNDCTINNTSQYNEIIAFAKNKIHVLTSQYGLANGPCSSSETENILFYKEQKLDFFRAQIENISPDYAIPSSSAIHFSCADNLWMNKFRASPTEAILKIDKGYATKMLYPSPLYTYNFEDKITLFNDKKYEELFNNLLRETEHKIVGNEETSFSIDKIAEAVEERAMQMRQVNNVLILWVLRYIFKLLRPIYFNILDLRHTVLIDPLKGTLTAEVQSENAILINSYVLENLYSSPYGVDALNASARFDITGNYNLETLNNHLNIATLNTAGIYINLKEIIKKEVFMKLLRVFKQWYNFKKNQSKYNG